MPRLLSSLRLKNVKRFFEITRQVLQFLGRLAEITGDTLAGIKVGVALCDKFIEKRKNGELKDVDFLTYLEALTSLISSLSPYAVELLDDVEEISNIVAQFFKFKSEYNELNNNAESF